MSEEFAGDVLLFDTDNGGQISILNGLVMPDKRFSTAAYISLFGGNDDDMGRVDNNKTWWGNRFSNISNNELVVSRFQSLTKKLPLTSKNIALAEQAARDDLNWMIMEDVADEVSVAVQAIDKNRINLNIVVKKDGSLLDEGNWTLRWEGGE